MKNFPLFFRKAELRDVVEITRSRQEIAQVPGLFCSLPEEFSESQTFDDIKASQQNTLSLFLIAEYKGKIVAHAYLEPFKTRSLAHIVDLQIAVHRGYQNKGIGTQILQKLIEWAKQVDQIEKIKLNVRSTNFIAIALYEKLGFKMEGRLVNYIKLAPDHYIDDFIMGLDVKNG